MADYELNIHNVCCTVTLGCPINLQLLAENSYNVELRNSKITLKLRKPRITAFVWGKGTIMCIGARGEEEARMGARRIARLIQRRGFDVKLGPIRMINVLACCTLPFRIRIDHFARRYTQTSYEPEIHPAAFYQVSDLKAYFHIYSTGSVMIIAPTVAIVHKAADLIYNRVKEFRRNLSAADEEARSKRRILAQRRLLFQ